MDNITPLTNVHNNILKNFLKTGKKINKELKRKNINWEKWSKTHYSIEATEFIDPITLETIESLLQQKLTIDYYRITKGSSTPHKDRWRRCWIQIPIKKVNNAWTFSVKDNCFDLLNKYLVKDKKFGKYQPREFWINKDADVDYDYQKEYFDHYDGSTPYIQNTSMPHGGISNAQEDRYLFSINIISHSYKETVELFKEWI